MTSGDKSKGTLFKGGSTNPFVKKPATADKKPVEQKKSEEIREEYSGGFIEDVYDDDFI